MRATEWRATAIRFQQFGEGARVNSIAHTSRARGADDGGCRRRNASYGVSRDSNKVSPRYSYWQVSRARETCSGRLVGAAAGGDVAGGAGGISF